MGSTTAISPDNQGLAPIWYGTDGPPYREYYSDFAGPQMSHSACLPLNAFPIDRNTRKGAVLDAKRGENEREGARSVPKAWRGRGRGSGARGEGEGSKKKRSNPQNPSFCPTAKKPLTPPGGWGGPPRTLRTRGCVPRALRTRHPMGLQWLMVGMVNG